MYCGDNCLNRIVYYECDECCESCTNNVIQKKVQPSIETFKTNGKGLGIKATEFIPRNTYITEYIGEIISRNTFEQRLQTQYSHFTHHYGMSFHNGLVIDAYKIGNHSRFINHSCDANSEIQKWMVKGVPKMCFFSTKDIKCGEEITLDYKFARSSPASIKQPCLCRSLNCRLTF